MKDWIKFQNVKGETSRQAHADFPEGTYEREMGREGFFGPASHLYHKHIPTGWTDWEGPLKPRAYDLAKLNKQSNSPINAKMILHNASCKYRIWQCNENMEHLFRNGDGDDLLFIHEGSGELFCDFGHMSYRDGDYILIPRSSMWRIEPKESTTILMIEATNGAYKMPDKGLVGPHAIFDQAMFDTPEIDEAFKAQQTEDTWKVQIKKQEQISTVTYPFNPLDAVGWKGDNTVVLINWRDIRPLMSDRYHLPPSAHITFVADRFVICTFAPRPFERDPGALKIPFFHNNDDYDEVLFYHAGDFFSRDNIHPGMVTFHPAGFAHGPHPKALKRAFEQTKEGTDEVAVMLDTRDPLEQGDGATEVEFKDYVNSWNSQS